MVYEYTWLGRLSLVQPESSRINFPVEDLILNNIYEFFQATVVLTQDLVVDKSLAYGTNQRHNRI